MIKIQIKNIIKVFKNNLKFMNSINITKRYKKKTKVKLIKIMLLLEVKTKKAKSK